MFTLVVVNIVVFFVTYLMASASIDTNVGFGLFALFAILRFRTGTLPVLDTTYLFAGIALATFNALALTQMSSSSASSSCSGGVWLSHQPREHSITYERIELVHPERRAELLEDLQTRTGLQIESIVVHDINFLNDTARISIHVPAMASRANRGLVHASSERYEP